jgi:hypothetical protein
VVADEAIEVDDAPVTGEQVVAHSAGTPNPALTVLHKVAPAVGAIAAYALIGVVAFWPLVPRFSDSLLGGEQDYQQFVWYVGAVAHQLSHGLNPLFSNAIFVPTGVNIAQNLSAPLLGALVAPITLAFGPVISANLLLLLAMPLSATAAYLVLRHWKVWWPAAALGGLMFGFSPYMVGQAQGHVQFIFLPLLPLIALTVTSILKGRGSSLRLGVQLAVLVAAEFLISEEVMTIVTLFIIAAIVGVAIRHPRRIRGMARTAAGALLVAVVVGAVLLAYPVWMTVAGPQHFTGPAWPEGNPYHSDLLSFVVPGPLQTVTLGMRSLQAQVLGATNPTEAGGYIGIPLLILAAIFAWRSRRSPRMQLAVVLMLCAALLTLGPHLTVGGELTTIKLPFVVFDHLPLLNDVLPVRISLEMDAFLAAVIAFGLDDMRATPSRLASPAPAVQPKGRLGLSVPFAAVTLVVLVATWLPQWPYGGLPVGALPASVVRVIPAGDPVAITYPYATAYDTEPMVFQAEAGFTFRLLGGYAWHPDSSGGPTGLPSIMQPPALQHFLGAEEGAALYGPVLPLTTQLVASARTALANYDVRLVIVERQMPDSGVVDSLFTDALGPPQLSTGLYTVWAS